ncbi:hypothetical protein QWY14_07780 [Planococcus sp. N028]|uniref:Uncharacterized protein n=1 Tax=Planococcus shixiaomingii TaxID=3058393 RepID=A0ABT8N1E5_9BACL|nr:hypothetical protein [Planococcus sp. N028]MDN7241689.1 hypothetical protein [Planococcus sp. N028]
MNYEEMIKSHLADYKVKKLAITAPQTWRGGKKKYHYILPADQWDLNFLSQFRAESSKWIKDKEIKLHHSFHHLNSSQAVCFNFFYPLIIEGQLSLVLKILHVEDEPIEEWAFEKIMPGGEKTNFDFYLKLKSGKEILFEIKYTERGFGKVPASETYEKQFLNVYRTMLAGKIRMEVAGYETLAKNYQLLRNIAHVEPGDKRSLVFICPENNKKLHKEYQNVLDNLVMPALHQNIHMVTWESLLKRLKIQMEAEPNNLTKLADHYREFEEKYFPFQIDLKEENEWASE